MALLLIALLAPQAWADEPKTQRSLVIWAHSDIQPRNNKERKQYERAISDMRENMGPVDMAVVPGDLVQWGRDKEYQWLLKARASAPVPAWFEIAGNHDARNYANYFKYIQKPPRYTVEVGNLLIIFLSDEVNSSASEFSDDTFQWWKQQVVDNQDKIIITVTHAYLKQSELFASFLHRSNIVGSKRFAAVLKKHRVALWLVGHTTVPPGIGRSEHMVEKLGGTLFVNVSAIREDLGQTSRSRLIRFKNGSAVATLKLRDHHHQQYLNQEEISLVLKHPFRWDGKKPELKAPPGTIMPSRPHPAPAAGQDPAESAKQN